MFFMLLQKMFSFPPFGRGSVFTASKVVSGIQLVSPSHSHDVDEVAASTRDHFFRMALHPFSLHVMDKAARTTNKERFIQSLDEALNELHNSHKQLYQILRQATNFVPVVVGHFWLSAKDSFLIKAVSPWDLAVTHINKITSMLQEFGLLQEDTFDNEAGVCAIRYYDMVDDLSKLTNLIHGELQKGESP